MKGAKILVTVDVIGSTGPIRFVVDEEERVADVIRTALLNYARQRRLPVLGSDIDNFLLYCSCAEAGYKALSPWESIGSSGSRRFELYHKPPEDAKSTRTPGSSTVNGIGGGIGGTRKVRIDKYFRFIVHSVGCWRWIEKNESHQQQRRNPDGVTRRHRGDPSGPSAETRRYREVTATRQDGQDTLSSTGRPVGAPLST